MTLWVGLRWTLKRKELWSQWRNVSRNGDLLSCSHLTVNRVKRAMLLIWCMIVGKRCRSWGQKAKISSICSTRCTVFFFQIWSTWAERWKVGSGRRGRYLDWYCYASTKRRSWYLPRFNCNSPAISRYSVHRSLRLPSNCDFDIQASSRSRLSVAHSAVWMLVQYKALYICPHIITGHLCFIP